MLRFLTRRLLAAVSLLLGSTLVVFCLLRFVPGDFVSVMLGSAGAENPEMVARFRHEYGLDRPLPEQYGRWLWKLARGDLGTSAANGLPVSELLGARLGATALLALPALALAAVGGVALGMLTALAAARGRQFRERLLSIVALALATTPPFSLGLLLISLFAARLGWLPAEGMRSVTGGGIGDALRHLALPALTLAAGLAAMMARLTRAGLLEILGQDYMRVARAKGLNERAVLWRHAFRNLLLVVVTNLGLMFAGLLGGNVLVESVFAWPGLGQPMVQAISMRDYPVVQGVALLISAIYVLATLAVDISYAWIDPRLRVG